MKIGGFWPIGPKLTPPGDPKNYFFEKSYFFQKMCYGCTNRLKQTFSKNSIGKWSYKKISLLAMNLSFLAIFGSNLYFPALDGL